MFSLALKELFQDDNWHGHFKFHIAKADKSKHLE